MLNKGKALWYTCLDGKYNRAKKLIKEGASVDWRSADGRTPLFIASSNGHKDIIRLLLDNCCRINAKSDYGSTALHRAVWNGNDGVASLLIERGANVYIKNRNGKTPLDFAKQHSRCERNLRGKEKYDKLICILEEALTSSRGRGSELYWACCNGKYDKAKLLINEGADIEWRYVTCGRTPLLVASAYGHEGIIQLLLDNDANINAKDKDGRTSLDLAKEYNHSSAADIIETAITISKDPPALRFSVGERIECRLSEDEWLPGTIVQCWYRESHWPSHSYAPYEVQLDDGRLIFAPTDLPGVVRHPYGIVPSFYNELVQETSELDDIKMNKLIHLIENGHHARFMYTYLSQAEKIGIIDRPTRIKYTKEMLDKAVNLVGGDSIAVFKVILIKAENDRLISKTISSITPHMGSKGREQSHCDL